MRLIFLITTFLVAAPAHTQSSPGDGPPPAPVVESGERSGDDSASDSRPEVTRSTAVAETAARQPTVRGFLYQVLLAATTALVTALIWKAVF